MDKEKIDLELPIMIKYYDTFNTREPITVDSSLFYKIAKPAGNNIPAWIGLSMK